MARLSVIILTYNRPFFLRQAIDAALKQTCQDIELIILDNGSDPETCQLVRGYIDNNNVRYIRNQINDRSFVNIAFSVYTGEYLMITHDDDIMEPEFLEKTISVLDSNPEVAMVATNISQINFSSELLKSKTHKVAKDKVWKRMQYIKYYLYHGNILPCPTFVFRASVIRNNGIIFNINVGPMADLYLVFRLNLLENSIYFIKDPLYRYRVHENQDSELNRIAMEKQVRQHISELLREYGQNDLASSYEKSSQAQILYLLIFKFISGNIDFKTCKGEMEEFKSIRMINKYSLIWTIKGILRGIKHRMF